MHRLAVPLRLVLLLLVLALGTAACGSDEEGGGARDGRTDTRAAETSPERVGCQDVETPRPKPEGDLEAPERRLDPEKTWVAVVTTSCGTFEITLDVERAPRTTASFASLARRGFFDDLLFHRVSQGFVIQTGSPSGDSFSGPGYSVVEQPPSDLRYTRGVVAMARADDEEPGTSGSQWFAVTAEDGQLPPEYALVGRVTEGQEVVDRIGVVETDVDERPLEPVVVEQVRIVER